MEMKYASWVEKHLDVRSKMGEEWLVLCPVHHDSNASCCINVRKGKYICYSCGARGSLDSLAAQMSVPMSVSFNAGDIRRQLNGVKRQNVPAMRSIPETWLDQFHWQHTHPYWEERGVEPRTARRWKLGFDRGRNAVTIPMRALNGDLMGVIHRFIGEDAKGDRYRYPKGFKISIHLFGAHLCAGKELDNIVVTEGSIDAILMAQEGYHAVALLGKILHPHQLTIMGKLDSGAITLMLDNDDDGREATRLAAGKLFSNGHIVRIAKESKYKDAGEMPSSAHRKQVIREAISYIDLRRRERSASMAS